MADMETQWLLDVVSNGGSLALLIAAVVVTVTLRRRGEGGAAGAALLLAGSACALLTNLGFTLAPLLGSELWAQEEARPLRIGLRLFFTLGIALSGVGFLLMKGKGPAAEDRHG